MARAVVSVGRLGVLLQANERRLVKTRNFVAEAYLGDPIITLRIFSGLEVDEVVFLDITNTSSGTRLDFALLQAVASASRAPLTYGGGISSVPDAEQVISLGVERLILGRPAINRPELTSTIARAIGIQSVVFALDTFTCDNSCIRIYSPGTQLHGSANWKELAKQQASLGAGEILIQNVNRDGCWTGLNLRLLDELSDLNIPISLGSGMRDGLDALNAFSRGAAAAVGGSCFTFAGQGQGVLPNYDYVGSMRSFIGRSE